MSDAPAPDFAGLLARAADGDTAALDELARHYEPKIRMVARVLLGPALRPYLDSVDLTQSVHKSILIGLRDEKYDISGPDQLIGLALTVLRRKAARHWRHLQRQHRLSGDGARPVDDLPGVLTALSSNETDPAAEALVRDEIRNLCDHLDEVERKILDLRLEGYTSAEIGEQIGLSRVNVRVRMTRLRQRLHALGVSSDWL